MKKIIIGTLVATAIFFMFQTMMWMGGFNNDFTSYTTNQEAIMQTLSENLDKDGFYMMPATDPSSADAQEREKSMAEQVGKPWAMVFYHSQMKDMSAGYILIGLFYTFIACLVVSSVLYTGNFQSFKTRFFVAMAFAVFALVHGVLNGMNWWSYPWSFIKPEVIDLTLGWGLASLWLAWYVKKSL